MPLDNEPLVTPPSVSLLDKVNARTEPAADCQVWTGSQNGHGYGTMMVYVHRVVWEYLNGPVPVGSHIAHTCDVRNCVNPDHLVLMSKAENEADKVKKGRASRGEERWSAKLTEDKVREIRRRAAGGERRRDLGVEFGVTVGTIDTVVTRKRWSHVV